MSHQSRFAPVAPVRMLEKLDECGALGNYHLLLAHDVLQHQDEFRKLFSKPDHLLDEIIVDNSVIELGQPIEFRKIQEAANILPQANVTVVLPDVLMDRVRTSRVVNDAMSIFNFGSRNNLMFVPQGSTLTEFVASAEEFMYEKTITHIGVPRNLLQVTDTRTRFIQLMRQMYPHLPLHLLGFSDDLVDDFISVNMEGVRGIDSAVPIRIGSLDMLFIIANARLIPSRNRQPGWWENGIYKQMCLSNVVKVRRLCGE